LRFTGFKANTAVDASVFQFKPPPGVDLIRTQN
jgi:outer membrane lipoprotein-sorting protein